MLKNISTCHCLTCKLDGKELDLSFVLNAKKILKIFICRSISYFCTCQPMPRLRIDGGNGVALAYR